MTEHSLVVVYYGRRYLLGQNVEVWRSIEQCIVCFPKVCQRINAHERPGSCTGQNMASSYRFMDGQSRLL